MSEPISELVRAYTAEIASLRAENELLQQKVRALKAVIGGGDTAIRQLDNQISVYEAALREIREFAVAHHESQESCVWLHGLTIDIPAMCDMALPLPQLDDTVEVSQDSGIPF